MTKYEFIERYVKRIVKEGIYDGSDEDMIYYARESAEAAFIQWCNPNEGLQTMSPEDMADEEMDCWEA